MSDEDEVEAPPPAGMPGWVMTFADLMSLLMCFFVLLLSFSQMDLSKFKKVAGSMEKAFGVQRDIVTYDIPKGTSIIAQEFSPGKPMPTPINEIKQKTIDLNLQTLDFAERNTKGKNKNTSPIEEQEKLASQHDVPSESEEVLEEARQESDAEAQSEQGQETDQGPGQASEAGQSQEELQNQMRQRTEDFADSLHKEISSGAVELEAFGDRLILRILEENTFQSGDERINESFMPKLIKIRNLLEKHAGPITVSGHTDNVPIYNSQFRSNWELSTSRAVSVAHVMLEGPTMDKSRISVSGHADTKPLFPNDTPKHRSRNRRIEITLEQGEFPDIREVKAYDGELAPIERDASGRVMQRQAVEELYRVWQDGQNEIDTSRPLMMPSHKDYGAALQHQINYQSIQTPVSLEERQ